MTRVEAIDNEHPGSLHAATDADREAKTQSAEESVAADQSAKYLAASWGLKTRHTLYRKTGNWYHKLKKFPGALLDADGYVVFESEQAFNACPQLQVRKQVSAPKGIKAIPGYVYMSPADIDSDRALVEPIVRPHVPATGQGWGGSAEGRRAVEAYAMDLAARHYAALWREVIDVSATESFDLLCRDENRELTVEVKGTTTNGRFILLTRNEVRHAQENNGRVALFVVSQVKANATEGCSGGIIQVFEPWDIREDELDPVAYRCKLRAARP